jgi:hypothetical protein
MPIKLSAPLEHEFTLDRSDKLFGTDGESTRITIRQATQEQKEKRDVVFSTITRIMSSVTSPDDEVALRQRWSWEELKRVEVFLTLVSCNLLDENGSPLFKFKNDKNGHQNLDMTDVAFRDAWGKLPPEIADEIHENVRSVNLTWAGPLGS